MRRAFKSALGTSIFLLGLCACSTHEPGLDHPDQDPAPARAPDLEPPPAQAQALSPQEVLDRVRAAEDPGDAVRELDRYPFAFELDAARLAWFDAEGVPPAVADYLAKRAEVDWEALRGDVDPSSPR
ncbi:MAG: hypothetical protein R3F62_27935 [Planctomycetota bacterium]